MSAPLQALVDIKQKAKERSKTDYTAFLSYLATVKQVSKKELQGVLRIFVALRLADTRTQLPVAKAIVAFMSRLLYLGSFLVFLIFGFHFGVFGACGGCLCVVLAEVVCVCVCVCVCLCVCLCVWWGFGVFRQNLPTTTTTMLGLSVQESIAPVVHPHHQPGPPPPFAGAPLQVSTHIITPSLPRDHRKHFPIHCPQKTMLFLPRRGTNKDWATAVLN